GMVGVSMRGWTVLDVSDINDAGGIVGYAVNAAGNVRAFYRFPGDANLTDLGVILGGSWSRGIGVNNWIGEVVGSAEDAGRNEKPFFKSPWRAMTDIGTLGGLQGRCNDINDRHEIVGSSEIAGAPAFYHGFVRDDFNRWKDIGVLRGHDASHALRNNFHHQVVGVSLGGAPARAILFEPGRGIQDLNILVANVPAGWR